MGRYNGSSDFEDPFSCIKTRQMDCSFDQAPAFSAGRVLLRSRLPGVNGPNRKPEQVEQRMAATGRDFEDVQEEEWLR